MNRLLNVLFFTVFLLVMWGCEKEQANIIYDKAYIDEIKLARKDLGYYMGRNDIPGTTIAVAKDNRIIYSEGLGYASKDLDVPMTRNIKFRIGDVSQIFTCLMYLKMVEEGVLNPDSTVQHYIPDYPPTDSKLSIKYLPYHTSGIRKDELREREMDRLNPSIQKGLDLFKNDPLTAVPGWFEEISMFNSNLLGAVMEKATMKTFSELVKKYITDTLHLTNTLVEHPSLTIKGKSDFFHTNMLGQCINAPCKDLRFKAPASGILSNAEDLVKLGMAILESDYFNAKFREKLFEPCDLYGNYKSSMANGWLLTFDKSGRKVNVSGGGITGGGAAVLIYPEERLVLACAINLTMGNDNMPLYEIASHFLGDKNSPVVK